METAAGRGDNVTLPGTAGTGGGVREWGRRALEAAVSLLSPAPFACLVCGRHYRFTSGAAAAAGPAISHRLCPDCRDSIPWIGRIVCPVCGRPETCGDCARREAPAFICSRSAVTYDETIRSWIAQYKYRGHEALGAVFGDMINIAYTGLRRELERRDPAFRFDAAVPVPLSMERLRERGFNQAEQLASAVAGRHGPPLARLLIRTRDSGKQSEKSRMERIRGTRNLFAADEAEIAALIARVQAAASARSGGSAFSRSPGDRSQFAADCSTGARPVILRLLLVDDIYTTGSTVNACAAVLKTAVAHRYPGIRPEIYVVTLARS